MAARHGNGIFGRKWPPAQESFGGRNRIRRRKSHLGCRRGISPPTPFRRCPFRTETGISRKPFPSDRRHLRTHSRRTDQIAIDVAFRVIADHIRTLSFAIADGIQPGNTDRHYVLRRILRRAVRYGRTLGFREPFFYKLVPVLAREFGEVFPEIRARQKHVEEVLKREEEAFNKTLDKGNQRFEIVAKNVSGGSDGKFWLCRFSYGQRKFRDGLIRAFHLRGPRST